MKAARQHPFDHIAIIYNPRATSQRADKIAGRLVRRLRRIGLDEIEVISSKKAGHARVLAYTVATQHRKPLIISVSGDGGYNEVINGVMDAAAAGKAGTPYTAVEAAGNANDHFKTMRKKRPLISAIKWRESYQIDLLQLEAVAPNFYLKRFAHSYIGLGVTPYVAREFNREKLTRWKELQIAARLLAKFPPVSILQDNGKSQTYDSLIFSNIRRMAKVLQLAKLTEPDDGTFEVVAHPHQRRRTFLLQAAKLAIRGRKSSQKTRHFHFWLPEAQGVQFDGEVVQLPPNCEVTVTCRHHALRTF